MSILSIKEKNMDRVQSAPVIPAINENASDSYNIMESKERKESDSHVHKQKTRADVSDSVHLSDTARLMAAVQQEINMVEEKEKNGFSDEQRQKIEDIKARIASGEYTIDSQKIAKSILLEEDILIK